MEMVHRIPTVLTKRGDPGQILDSWAKTLPSGTLKCEVDRKGFGCVIG